MPSIRAFSFGGGVQSMAALVLAAQGKIDFNTFLFANVGEDSENPDTIDYFRRIAVPYAASAGISLHELYKTTRSGERDTLMNNVLRTNRSIPIPVRMSSGAPGRRNCTSTFKINVVAKWMKRHGATAAAPGVLGLGISMDEFQRMRTNSGFDFYTLEYPLISSRLTRQDCKDIIAGAGLDVPPKSSCWFCPFHRMQDWIELRRNRPDLFEQSAQLEEMLNRRRETLGRDHVFLSRRSKPLREAIPSIAPSDDDGEHDCKSGYCFL